MSKVYWKGERGIILKVNLLFWRKLLKYRTWNLPFNKTLNPNIYYLKVFIFAFPISIFVKSVLTIGNDMIKNISFNILQLQLRPSSQQ